MILNREHSNITIVFREGMWSRNWYIMGEVLCGRIQSRIPNEFLRISSCQQQQQQKQQLHFVNESKKIMAETKTHYLFQNKSNVLVETFKNLYENAEDTDVTFVSSEGIELKCHKLILSINEFFRDLFENETENLKIYLPNYSYGSINILLKFFYTGSWCIIKKYVGRPINSGSKLVTEITCILSATL